jgi:hypothetical protein
MVNAPCSEEHEADGWKSLSHGASIVAPAGSIETNPGVPEREAECTRNPPEVFLQLEMKCPDTCSSCGPTRLIRAI